MKHLYVCEKCGAQYDDWDEANRCEDSHQEVQVIEWTDLVASEASTLMSEATHYKHGEALPDVIPVKFRIRGEDGRYLTDENGQYIYESVLYAIIKNKNTQGELLEKLDASMAARRKQDYEESKRWREEWEAKQAEKATE